jgi:2-haloacid dehalogenase
VKGGVDAVIFDMGGVLLDWNLRHLYRRLLPDEATVESFLASVCTADWHRQHDQGRPMAETIPELCARFPEQAHLIQQWRTRFVEMVRGEIDGMYQLVSELHLCDVPLYLLSNLPREVCDAMVSSFRIFRFFRDKVFSGKERVAKPDEQIYRIALSRFGVAGERTLFVDDIPANVEAARRVGLLAVPFLDAARLRQQLVDVGLLGG